MEMVALPRPDIADREHHSGHEIDQLVLLLIVMDFVCPVASKLSSVGEADNVFVSTTSNGEYLITGLSSSVLSSQAMTAMVSIRKNIVFFISSTF